MVWDCTRPDVRNWTREDDKLWGTMMFIICGLLTVSLLGQPAAMLAMDRALVDVQRYGDRITDAVLWKGLTETKNVRRLATLISSDPATMQVFGSALKAGTEDISVVQKRVAAAADSAADRRALDLIAERRTTLLTLTKKATAPASGAEADATRSEVRQQYPAGAAAYVEALGGFVKVQQGNWKTPSRSPWPAAPAPQCSASWRRWSSSASPWQWPRCWCARFAGRSRK